jgi:DeoR family glycerol-3-phosphate regulon repressor
MVEVGRLDQIDRLFTDQAPPPPFGALLSVGGVDCVVASGEFK